MSGVIVFTSIFAGRENKVPVFASLCLCLFVLLSCGCQKKQMFIRLEHRSIDVNGSLILFEGEENQPNTIRRIVNVIVTLWKK